MEAPVSLPQFKLFRKEPVLRSGFHVLSVARKSCAGPWLPSSDGRRLRVLLNGWKCRRLQFFFFPCSNFNKTLPACPPCPATANGTACSVFSPRSSISCGILGCLFFVHCARDSDLPRVIPLDNAKRRKGAASSNRILSPIRIFLRSCRNHSAAVCV